MKQYILLVLLNGLIHCCLAQPWNNLDTDRWSQDYRSIGQRADPNVCSPSTCKIPQCFCAGNTSPRKMDPKVIPQMVMFTFDDALNQPAFEYVDEIFPASRTNPNGCPVSVTFFVSNNGTNYELVKEMYERGHEIGSHSQSHRLPMSWWRYGPAEDWELEIQGQRETIAEKASVPIEEIRGMRAPFLDTGGDEQFKMLEKHGFEYDASFMTGPHDKGGAWPFTMDFVPSWEYCTNLNCPKEKHPGIWEVPLNRWVGTDGKACSMVDSCDQSPKHKGETLAYLWQNFNRHYYGNRAPFGVNMHATWFKVDHHFEAMKEFVKVIAEMNDVYIVTVHQTLQWVRNPKDLNRAQNFKPWMKSCQGDTPRNREPQADISAVLEEMEEQKVEKQSDLESGKFLLDDNSDDVMFAGTDTQDYQSGIVFKEGQFNPALQSDSSNLVNLPGIRSIELDRIQTGRSQRRLVGALSDHLNRRPQQIMNINEDFIKDARFEGVIVANNNNDLENAILMALPEELHNGDDGMFPYSDPEKEYDHELPNNLPIKPETIFNEIPMVGSTLDETSKERLMLENYYVNPPNINDVLDKQSSSQNQSDIAEIMRTKSDFEKYLLSNDGDKELHNNFKNKIHEFDHDEETKEFDGDQEMSDVVKEFRDDETTPYTLTPNPPTPKIPFRPRFRSNRPRFPVSGVPGRTDLQSRQRNRKNGMTSSASSHELSLLTVVTSGTIAVYYIHQAAWV